MFAVPFFLFISSVYHNDFFKTFLHLTLSSDSETGTSSNNLAFVNRYFNKMYINDLVVRFMFLNFIYCVFGAATSAVKVRLFFVFYTYRFLILF